jgi:hypothetical protein
MIRKGGIVHLVEYQMPYQTNIYCKKWCVWYEIVEEHAVTLRQCFDAADDFTSWDGAAIYAEALKAAHEAKEIVSSKMKMVVESRKVLP